VALDLAQNEKGKPDQGMTAKATALLQKGRTLPEGGRWNEIATVGLLRLEYQAGQYAQALADYQRSKDQVPEEVRPEMMLLAGNSQRQLGHFKEAQTIYQQIIQKYPGRDEAKDARYQRLIGLYNANDPAQLYLSQALLGFAFQKKCAIQAPAEEVAYERALNRANQIFQGYVLARGFVTQPADAASYSREMAMGAIRFAAASGCDERAQERVGTGNRVAADFQMLIDPYLRRPLSK
jgi:tetratricopeptide (TPR) repeat protein